MNPTPVYKLVTIKDGQRMSFAGAARLSPYNIIYEPNKIVTPKLGTIFAFDTRENAEWFWDLEDGSEAELWLAEGYDVAPVEEIASVTFFMGDGARVLRWFWNTKRALNPNYMTRQAPKGTVGCKSLKLVELLDKSLC